MKQAKKTEQNTQDKRDLSDFANQYPKGLRIGESFIAVKDYEQVKRFFNPESSSLSNDDLMYGMGQCKKTETGYFCCTPSFVFKVSEKTVAADYLDIVKTFIEMLESNTDALEKEANASGKTLINEGTRTFGVTRPLIRK